MSSGVTGGGGAEGAECPQRLLTEISADLSEKRGKEKRGKGGENWEEKMDNCGKKVEKFQSEERTFFFFFFFFRMSLFGKQDHP